MKDNDVHQAAIAEILARIEKLAELANDPPAFSQLRREILSAYIGRMETSRAEQHRLLQEEIENMCAASGSPMMAVLTLLQMWDDRVAAIDNLGRTLKV